MKRAKLDRALRAAVFFGLTLGCAAEDESPSADPADADTNMDSDGETSGQSAGGTEPGPLDPTDPNPTGDPSDTDDVTFIVTPDGAGPGVECDVWTQDCPQGEKCMPYATDGGNSWNGTKCTPVDGMPDQPGSPCVVEGSGVSGVDSCDVASMCWDVDPETNEGTCTAFCTGAAENAVCDDPNTACSITNDGVLILCLEACDPLSQDCQDGQACYGIDDSFVCAPDASGEPGLYGDPCEFLNSCDPGLACVGAAGVPGCTGSAGCCSTFCDLDDAGASAACEGAAGGQECVSWFEEGAAPPSYENTGVCFIPQ